LQAAIEVAINSNDIIKLMDLKTGWIIMRVF